MGDVSGDDQRSLNPYGQPSAPENLDSALVSVDAMFNDGQLEIQTRVRSEFADQATLVSFVRAVRAEMVWKYWQVALALASIRCFSTHSGLGFPVEPLV